MKVVVVIGGNILLGCNPRGDWKLLGGWTDNDDASLEETAIGKVHGELTITISPQRLINALILRDPTVENPVAIVAYGATIDSPEEALAFDHLLPAYKPAHCGLSSAGTVANSIVLKFSSLLWPWVG